jgi:hypothetical protein
MHMEEQVQDNAHGGASTKESDLAKTKGCNLRMLNENPPRAPCVANSGAMQLQVHLPQQWQPFCHAYEAASFAQMKRLQLMMMNHQLLESLSLSSVPFSPY